MKKVAFWIGWMFLGIGIYLWIDSSFPSLFIKPSTTLMGVSLSMTKEEVHYVLGEPDANPNVEHSIHGVDGVKIEIVYNNSNLVKTIVCHNLLYHTRGSDYKCSMYGLYLGNYEEVVIETLGEPSYVRVRNGFKMMHYDKLNLLIQLEKKRIVGFIVEDRSIIFQKKNNH